MVEEVPTSFSPFSLTDCMLFSHFSFDDFITAAFPDLAGDLDTQIQIPDITSFLSRQCLLSMLLCIAWSFPQPPTLSHLSTFPVCLLIVLSRRKVPTGLVYKTAPVFFFLQLVLCITCTVIQSFIPKDHWLDSSLTDSLLSPTRVQETRNSMCHHTTLECALLKI